MGSSVCDQECGRKAGRTGRRPRWARETQRCQVFVCEVDNSVLTFLSRWKIVLRKYLAGPGSCCNFLAAGKTASRSETQHGPLEYLSLSI